MKCTMLIVMFMLAFKSTVILAKRPTVEVLPEDEIKALLLDANMRNRNKRRSAGIAGVSLTTGVAIALFGKRSDLAAIPIMGGIIAGGYSCWMWWCQARSTRQAHELAEKHDIEIIDHQNSKEKNKIKQPKQNDI